jgi:hypothetical protein
MILCPNCKYQEYSGALYCSQCGSQIFTSANNTTSISTSEIKNKPGISPTPPPFPTPPVDFQNSILVIFLIEAGEIIFVDKESELTIGRSTEGQIIVPTVDLSPYDAYECGVSRLHANISIKNNQVTAKDLGSANGTRLNGKKISANAEHTLRHGDILTLGKLKIQILIKE